MTPSGLIRASGIAGIAGSLCFVVGDVLITPMVDFGDKTLIEIRASIDASRLYASGLLGALAVLCHVFAAWHAYLALRPGGPTVAALGVATLAPMLIFAGIYHAVFVAQNFGAKVALAAGSAKELALSLPDDYSTLLLS